MIAQILVADDSQEIVDLLSDYLQHKGHRLIVVGDGYQMSAKAAEHRPHLIITDIQMPGAYGSSAYQVLQKDTNTQNIPVIFMSGHPREKVEALLPKDAVRTRFLQKPLDFAKLDTAIAELLPLGGYCP